MDERRVSTVLGDIRVPVTGCGPVSVPVLVVAGAEDATFPVLETRAMADAIRGSRFVVLDGAAHLAALEDPGLVNSLIDDFVASV